MEDHRQYMANRVLELATHRASLRFNLQAAIDWAEGGHVPSPEQIQRWREAVLESMDADDAPVADKTAEDYDDDADFDAECASTRWVSEGCTE